MIIAHLFTFTETLLKENIYLISRVSAKTIFTLTCSVLDMYRAKGYFIMPFEKCKFTSNPL